MNFTEYFPEKKQAALHLLLFSLIILLAVFARSYELARPSSDYFDETYYHEAAQTYRLNTKDPNWVHPPFAKILIAAGMEADRVFAPLFGRPVGSAVAWRIFAMFFGTLTVALLWFFTLFLLRSPAAAHLAALLLAVETLHIVQSRIAMLDIFLAFFMFAAAVILWHYLETGKKSLFWLSALCTGLATSCKISGVFIIIAFFLCLMLLQKKKFRHALPLTAAYAAAAFAVYLLSYTSFFLQGNNLQALVEIHKNIYNFKIAGESAHTYLSPCWQWPLMIRPVWYFFFEISRQVSGIIALGSPLFWWTFLILLAWMICTKEKENSVKFMLILYFCGFIFWLPAKGFFFYMLPSVPWMCLISAAMLEKIRKKDKRIFWGYLISVLLFAILYYPLLTAEPIGRNFFTRLMWLRTWI